jgi:hypothetical protein
MAPAFVVLQVQRHEQVTVASYAVLKKRLHMSLVWLRIAHLSNAHSMLASMRGGKDFLSKM